jgi:hypothetical protein
MSRTRNVENFERGKEVEQTLVENDSGETVRQRCVQLLEVDELGEERFERASDDLVREVLLRPIAALLIQRVVVESEGADESSTSWECSERFEKTLYVLRRRKSEVLPSTPAPGSFDGAEWRSGRGLLFPGVVEDHVEEFQR